MVLLIKNYLHQELQKYLNYLNNTFNKQVRPGLYIRRVKGGHQHQLADSSSSGNNTGEDRNRGGRSGIEEYVRTRPDTGKKIYPSVHDPPFTTTYERAPLLKLTNNIDNAIGHIVRGENIFTGSPVLSETTRPVLIP